MWEKAVALGREKKKNITRDLTAMMVCMFLWDLLQLGEYTHRHTAVCQASEARHICPSTAFNCKFYAPYSALRRHCSAGKPSRVSLHCFCPNAVTAIADASLGRESAVQTGYYSVCTAE